MNTKLTNKIIVCHKGAKNHSLQHHQELAPIIPPHPPSSSDELARPTHLGLRHGRVKYTKSPHAKTTKTLQKSLCEIAEKSLPFLILIIVLNGGSQPPHDTMVGQY